MTHTRTRRNQMTQGQRTTSVVLIVVTIVACVLSLFMKGGFWMFAEVLVWTVGVACIAPGVAYMVRAAREAQELAKPLPLYPEGRLEELADQAHIKNPPTLRLKKAEHYYSHEDWNKRFEAWGGDRPTIRKGVGGNTLRTTIDENGDTHEIKTWSMTAPEPKRKHKCNHPDSYVCHKCDDSPF